MQFGCPNYAVHFILFLVGQRTTRTVAQLENVYVPLCRRKIWKPGGLNEGHHECLHANIRWLATCTALRAVASACGMFNLAA